MENSADECKSYIGQLNDVTKLVQPH